MLLDISIINYFDKGLSWDIFVQGFLVFLILTFAFLYLMYLLPDFHKSNQSLIDFYFITLNKKIKIYFINSNSNKNDTIDILSKITRLFQAATLTSAIIVLSFILGVIFSNVSDSFMDQNNAVHLGFKKNWTNLNQENNFQDTDEAIKIDIFDKIFGKNALNEESISYALGNLKKESILKNQDIQNYKKTRKAIIKELYYYSKHKILEDDKWAGYLAYSQTLVNLNQTFCFCIWILIIISTLGLIVTFSISLKDYFYNQGMNRHSLVGLVYILIFLFLFFANMFINYPSPELYLLCISAVSIVAILLIQFKLIRGYRLTTSLILVLLSIFLYHITAFSWQTCEIESCAKTYGLLIHMDEDLKTTTIDIFKKSIENN